MPRLSLNISVNNHTEIFRQHGGIFGKIPPYFIGHHRLERMVENKILEELKKELPAVLQDELEKRGIQCCVDIDEV